MSLWNRLADRLRHARIARFAPPEQRALVRLALGVALVDGDLAGAELAAAQDKLTALQGAKEHVLSDGVVPATMIRKWALWSGSAMMVTGGLTAFAFQWKSIVRAFAGLGALFKKDDTGKADPLAAIEVPNSWFGAGLLVSGIGCAPASPDTATLDRFLAQVGETHAHSPS